MKNLSFIGLFSLAILVSACGPNKEGTDAEVSEAKEVEAVEASQEYTIDAASSEVTWIGSKPTGKHNGTIPISEGTIAVEGDKIVGGSVIINIADIQNTDLTENADMQGKLVNHLKSQEFFHVDSFPTAEFVITSVSEYTAADKPTAKEEFESENTPATADKFMVQSPTHKITGNLTMRGTTLSVTFPANVQMQDGKINAKAKFNIDRTKWGVMYGDEASAVDKAKDRFVYNTVNIGFDLTAEANEEVM